MKLQLLQDLEPVSVYDASYNVYYLCAVFQVRGGSVTWPDKLMKNFWRFGEAHIYWPVEIPHWHLSFQNLSGTLLMCL